MVEAHNLQNNFFSRAQTRFSCAQVEVESVKGELQRASAQGREALMDCLAKDQQVFFLSWSLSRARAVSLSLALSRSRAAPPPLPPTSP